MTAKFLEEDIDRLKEIHDGSFVLPDHIICGRVGYHRDNIVAFLLAKPTIEAVLIVDKNLPKATKTKLIVELSETLKDDLMNIGHSEMHAFVKDAGFAAFLENYLGFKEVPGQVLVWHGA